MTKSYKRQLDLMDFQVSSLPYCLFSVGKSLNTQRPKCTITLGFYYAVAYIHALFVV